MIDLTKKDQLFFHWLERSENDRGLNFEKGHIHFDWYKVFSKADSRLKIDETLKFKLFDWVTKNVKGNFIENLFHKDQQKANFAFDLNTSAEMRLKYKTQLKAFAQAVVTEFEANGFKGITLDKAKLIKKEVESLENSDFLSVFPLKAWLRLDIDIQRVFKMNTYHSEDDRSYRAEPQNFNAFYPKLYQSKFSWRQRKTYSKSVVDLMVGLEGFYKSKSWQSAPEQRQDHLLESAYGTIYHLTDESRKTRRALPWVSLMVDVAERQPSFADDKLLIHTSSHCKELGIFIGKKARSRLKESLSHWLFYWNIHSKKGTISEPLKQAYLALEKSFQTQLDQDLEAATKEYFDQLLTPFDHLVDYLMGTYLPLSLFLSGVVRSFEDADGNHFLGFSQSAILHHLAQKALHRVPGQFPLVRTGTNPLFISSDPNDDLDGDEDWDLDDDLDGEDDWDLSEDFDDKMLGFFKNLYFARN